MNSTVTQRGDGHWYASFPHPDTGKRRQVQVQSEAQGWHLVDNARKDAALKAEKAKRSGVKEAPVFVDRGWTVEQGYELSMEKRFKHQRQGEKTVPHNYGMIRDYFGHRTQLAAITNIWFNEWRDFLLMKPRKASAVNRIAATLMAMRSDAIEYSKVLELPLLPKSLKVTKIPPRFLSQEEVNALLEFFSSRIMLGTNQWNQDETPGDELMADMFLFRLGEGCRFEEMQRVTPRDINLEADQITFWKTKNGQSRTVPLVGAAREICKRRIETLGFDELMFPYSYGQWHKRWTKGVEALGLQGRVVGHTCRHTMAARAVTANVSTQQLKHWGGWNSTAALDFYAHLDTQGLKEMAAALERYA